MPLALVIAGFLVCSTVLLARMNVMVQGQRYWTLADDQMISMRYAENLAHGLGLRWNAGDPPVEGFTNLVWTLYMAAWHWFGVPRPVISLCIQVTGVLLIVATLGLVWRLTGTLTDNPGAPFVAVVLTAFFYPLLSWAALGTEVSVLAPIVTGTSLLAYKALTSYQRPWALWLLLGASTLVRPDMVVIAGATLLAVAWLRLGDRWTRLASGLAVLGVFVAAATLARVAYFGDPLPNTYYLKMTGYPILARLTRGTLVTALFFIQTAPLLLLARRAGRRRDSSWRLFAVIVAFQFFYNLYIGGDAWESLGGSNRFVTVVMPLVAVQAAIGVSDLLPRARLARGAVLAVIVGLTNLLSLGLNVERPLERLLLLRPPAAFDEDLQLMQLGLAVKLFTREQAVVAVSTAGAIPYFSERPALDLLGKTDTWVARQSMHVPTGFQKWVGFWPGHLKWDFAHSIREGRPDVIQAPLQRDPSVNVAEFVEPDYRRCGQWYLRKDSPYIDWSRTPCTDLAPR